MRPFWKRKTLEDMMRSEWESLCDGCAKCCLHKLEDPDTGELAYTSVACRLLDLETCRCRRYEWRANLVPECIVLGAETMGLQARWMPATCAYRLLAEGGELPWWHPLVSGDPDTVIRSGNSACGWVISEDEADDLEHHIVGRL